VADRYARHSAFELDHPPERVLHTTLNQPARVDSPALVSHGQLTEVRNGSRVCGPVFDDSAALEVLSFNWPDLAEGLASLTPRRPPLSELKLA